MARIARFEQSNGPVRLDPYHRLLAGWGTPPRVMPIDGSGSAILRPEGPPLLFFDGSRGRGEYFLFEHRTPRRRYDGGTTAGVLAWTVAVDAEHRLHTFCWDPPAHDCDRRDMKSAFVVGPAGAGRLPGWMPDDGPFQLTWQNGDPIDLVFEVTQYADGGSVLSWAPAAGFRPRLDRARLSAEQLVVTGNFPDQDGLQVNVAGVVLPFSAHYADRVEFDNTEGLRVGHRVRAFFDGVPSNWLEIEAAAD
jgi:hypothetical protein